MCSAPLSISPSLQFSRWWFPLMLPPLRQLCIFIRFFFNIGIGIFFDIGTRVLFDIPVPCQTTSFCFGVLYPSVFRTRWCPVMRRVGFHAECPLRFCRTMGGLAPSGANLCPCVGLPPCRMGLGQSLALYRFLQVGSRTYLVLSLDSSAGNPVPPQPNGLSHQWFGKILGG